MSGIPSPSDADPLVLCRLFAEAVASKPNLTTNILNMAHGYAQSAGCTIVDITSRHANESDPFVGLSPKDRKTLHFMARNATTEAAFKANEPAPQVHGYATIMFLPPVAYLFRYSTKGEQRFLAIPSESAFGKTTFDEFLRA